MKKIKDTGDETPAIAAVAQRVLERLEVSFSVAVENNSFHVQHRVVRGEP